MPATIRQSAQNSNVYRAYGIVSSDRLSNCLENGASSPARMLFSENRLASFCQRYRRQRLSP